MSRKHSRHFFSRSLTFAAAAVALVVLAAFSQSFLASIGRTQPLAQAFAAGVAQEERAVATEREGEPEQAGEGEGKREGDREVERENPDDLLRSIQRYLDGAESAERRRFLELLLRDEDGGRRERRIILRREARDVDTEEGDEVERDEVVTEEGDNGKPRIRILRQRFRRLEDLGERFGEELERALEDGARLGADEIDHLKERGIRTLRDVLLDLERALDDDDEGEGSAGSSRLGPAARTLRSETTERRPDDPVIIARAAEAQRRDQARAAEIEVEIEKTKQALAAALEGRSDEKVTELARRIRDLERESMELRSRQGPAGTVVLRRGRAQERSRELEAVLRDLRVENDRLRETLALERAKLREEIEKTRAVAEQERRRAEMKIREVHRAQEQAEFERMREGEARQRAEALHKQAQREAERAGRELPS
ncbi:MAG TPA: hypothetical protein VK116_10735, partial [Planctomycetota bacterium]|nr:hypothetical protein [Planctomycetota bacterium]